MRELELQSSVRATGRGFRFNGRTPALVGRLAREAGVIAVKRPAPGSAEIGAHLAGVRDSVPDEFSLRYSGDWNAVEALLAGGDAWYSVMGGLFPETAMAIVRAVRDENAATARALDAELPPLWSLFREFLSLRVMYICAEVRGLCRTQPPRPILPLTGSARERVVDTLRSLDLH
jgi:4-hydroxy-tetrahydrodipicolinate synthase